ncbi:phage tail assembly chaperone [uncultured Bilophila sp.]|uniref:phage tail assembly chaperone n=1 Tax=uncultured Bilophila sp. TaxID=529385 RepID=UPI00280B0895|nr:hypothetical protein [uncultured Bilophila sp.]
MRKETAVTIEDRGNPLTFTIREMPATQLERWIIRAMLLLAGSEGLEGISGTSIENAGKYLSEHGLKALANVEYEKAQPLLDELLACCARTDAGVEQRCTPDTVDGYIEDVRTLFKLRVEAAKLNFGFFGASPSGSPADLHIGNPRKPKG